MAARSSTDPPAACRRGRSTPALTLGTVLNSAACRQRTRPPTVPQCNHRGWADFFVDMYATGARAKALSRCPPASLLAGACPLGLPPRRGGAGGMRLDACLLAAAPSSLHPAWGGGGDSPLRAASRCLAPAGSQWARPSPPSPPPSCPSSPSCSSTEATSGTQRWGCGRTFGCVTVARRCAATGPRRTRPQPCLDLLPARLRKMLFSYWPPHCPLPLRRHRSSTSGWTLSWPRGRRWAPPAASAGQLACSLADN